MNLFQRMHIKAFYCGEYFILYAPKKKNKSLSKLIALFPLASEIIAERINQVALTTHAAFWYNSPQGAVLTSAEDLSCHMVAANCCLILANIKAKTKTHRCQAIMTFPASETMSAADFPLCWFQQHSCGSPTLYSSVFVVGAVQSALSLARLVLVMRWQACKQSDWFSQHTSEASFSFLVIFHKRTLTASQS